MNQNLKLEPLAPRHFTGVINLGNVVHGDCYLDQDMLETMYKKSLKNGITCSFVMLDCSDEKHDDCSKIVGFRLTYAPTHWDVDQYCTPDLWKLPVEQLCYFKSSTVDSDYRGCGIAKTMLQASIEAVTKQGGFGGICHTWMQSPGNAAFHYFVKCGGVHLKTHPDRWLQDSIEGYRCVVCGADKYCGCDAGEMILYFDPAMRSD